jgi:hypothetical protein
MVEDGHCRNCRVRIANRLGPCRESNILPQRQAGPKVGPHGGAQDLPLYRELLDLKPVIGSLRLTKINVYGEK